MKRGLIPFGIQVLAIMVACTGCVDKGEEVKKPNVLFISIDDMNDWIGPLGGYGEVKTPCLNSLMEEGMLFEHAYCASPLCNPSRAALMTGIAPHRSGIYYNRHQFRSSSLLKNSKTIPQYLRDHGYYVAGAGKIYHNTWPDTASWDAYWPGKVNHMPRDPAPLSDERLNSHPLAGHFDWESLEVDEEQMGDLRSVRWISQQLNMKHEKPFFLACGIYKPHLPWYLPRQFFDMYPLEEIRIPETIPDDLEDLSEFAVGLAHGFGDIIDINTAPRSVPYDHEVIQERDHWKEAIRGYLAAISFADYCVGELIDALKNSPYWDNTVIILWSDHGYHLGEKEHWRKETLWEEATRNILFIRAPGMTIGSSTTDWPVSLLDIYPTMIDICGLQRKEELSGNSLIDLLKDPGINWDRPVLTTYGYKNHAIRSRDFRYIVYRDGSEELYDHSSDPNEWFNLIDDPGFYGVLDSLKDHLPEMDTEPVPWDI